MAHRTGTAAPRLADPVIPPPPPRLADADAARLEDLCADLAEVVRAGGYHTDEREGVLLDVTIGRVRCLLIEQEPALRVTLSPRERQIALMVAHGRTNQSIATSLDISVWTVSTHLRRIFAKLAVSSRAEMVARLVSDHDYAPLVAPDDPT
ncbi:helix-turn-helix transcriptional regulator [Nocardioides sp. MAHUQ-72]|uniref:helix-turn-helix transcriptional regulator n=1 Tax=unclassified Nocardioides TaxID=2615069 RepID=UPI00361BFABB